MGNEGAHSQTQGTLNLIHQPVLFFLLSLSVLVSTLDEAHAKILTMIPSLANYPPRLPFHGFLSINAILGPVKSITAITSSRLQSYRSRLYRHHAILTQT
ncbi:hypothetical protein CORC01_04947 [Colletotrichum orchidophilum]|uniref:Uncharacterized protein n=1 Tax=Colletotrichum orchidophilum TaxID=1209926 RepID=A0A1G4BEG9_9PEZI|nr:uncharacterized protein CORC01_04947 [Colletotrichum orchidophilum]OHE99811.1 hypothetical protein CORC01_04947 [Colletotrichum orchidophilum]